MGEQEWLESPDPTGLLRHLWRTRPYPVTARKLRLLACACVRRIWHLLPEEGRRAVEAAEPHADRLLSAGELQALQPPYAQGRDSAFYAVFFATAPNRSLRGYVQSVLGHSTWAARGRFVGEHGRDTLLGTAACPESVAQSHLVRDVFPNPFRPVSFDPAWGTPDVLALARSAYEDRLLPSGTLEPARLALLADALLDAGCTNANVLGHLRGPGPHVRGCWAVDLVLGRS